MIHLSESMTHSEFDFYDDLTFPLTNFLKEIDMTSKVIDESNRITIPKSVFEKPYNDKWSP